MWCRSGRDLLIALGLALACAAQAEAASGPKAYAKLYPGLGHAPSHAQLTTWDIDVRADGAGLPAGSGDVAQGEALFADRCASCHGDRGQNGIADRLVGGAGTLKSAKPVRTVGSYWPYATTLFDYVRRAMPYNAPRSLAPSQVYSLCAYILWLNRIVGRDASLDRHSLPRVVMPNRHGFIDASRRPAL